ncbi:MAG: hypothetical protein HC836_35320 [Richelia sp. RM2_1_2]|nr:hypothetical protein [Richelia sp. RM2_1_2]
MENEIISIKPNTSEAILAEQLTGMRKHLINVMLNINLGSIVAILAYIQTVESQYLRLVFVVAILIFFISIYYMVVHLRWNMAQIVANIDGNKKLEKTNGYAKMREAIEETTRKLGEKSEISYLIFFRIQ